MLESESRKLSGDQHQSRIAYSWGYFEKYSLKVWLGVSYVNDNNPLVRTMSIACALALRLKLLYNLEGLVVLEQRNVDSEFIECTGGEGFHRT